MFLFTISLQGYPTPSHTSSLIPILPQPLPLPLAIHHTHPVVQSVDLRRISHSCRGHTNTPHSSLCYPSHRHSHRHSCHLFFPFPPLTFSHPPLTPLPLSPSHLFSPPSYSSSPFPLSPFLTPLLLLLPCPLL